VRVSDEDPDRTGQSGAERPDDPPNPPFSRSPQYGVPPQYGQGQRPYGDPPPDYGPPTYGPPATYGQPPGQYGVPPPGAPPWGQQPYGAGQGPGLPAGTTAAGLGDRLLARIIDVIVLLPVTIIVWPLTFHGAVGSRVLGYLVVLGASSAYEIGMISQRGATVGKKARGIKVVSLVDGRIPTSAIATRRWAAATILMGLGTVLCLIPGIVSALSPAFDKSDRRQSWWDKLAGTVVVRAR
jgi:uncharacterized RDD family membrane protein YckC